MTWDETDKEFVKSKGFSSPEEYILANIQKWDYDELLLFRVEGVNIPESILKQKLVEGEKEKRSPEEQFSIAMMS